VNICSFALGMGEGFNTGGWVWLGCGLRWGAWPPFQFWAESKAQRGGHGHGCGRSISRSL
jgi:hypothetical protein